MFISKYIYRYIPLFIHLVYLFVFSFILQKETLNNLNKEKGDGTTGGRNRVRFTEAIFTNSESRRERRRAHRVENDLPPAVTKRGPGGLPPPRQIMTLGKGSWGMSAHNRQWMKPHFPAGIKVSLYIV